MDTFLTPIDNPAFYDFFLVLNKLNLPKDKGPALQLDTALEIHRALKGKGTSAFDLHFDSENTHESMKDVMADLTGHGDPFDGIKLPVLFSGHLLTLPRVVYYTPTEIVAIATIYAVGKDKGKVTVSLYGDYDLTRSLGWALDERYGTDA